MIRERVNLEMKEIVKDIRRWQKQEKKIAVAYFFYSESNQR